MQNKNLSILLSIILNFLIITLSAAEEDRVGQSLQTMMANRLAIINFISDKMVNMNEITQEYFILALNGYTPVQMQEFYDLRTQLWEDLPNPQWGDIFFFLAEICNAANRLDVAKLMARFIVTIGSVKNNYLRINLMNTISLLPVAERSERVTRALAETACIEDAGRRFLTALPILTSPLDTP